MMMHGGRVTYRNQDNSVWKLRWTILDPVYLCCPPLSPQTDTFDLFIDTVILLSMSCQVVRVPVDDLAVVHFSSALAPQSNISRRDESFITELYVTTVGNQRIVGAAPCRAPGFL
jgi:hypothetical protein